MAADANATAKDFTNVVGNGEQWMADLRSSGTDFTTPIAFREFPAVDSNTVLCAAPTNDEIVHQVTVLPQSD